ncbi:MAG: pyridoxine 5'-phosphate synthase [Polyangia bacterium]|jgi:pyridoxine 5-phosphate synthase|nr:pyridoxine 5'-phosphate synthase [Polyangia bacterium]
MRRIRLHVNIDHIATLRQARGTSYPDPVWAAALCELAGADGITAHLREDRRHIQDRDVELLRRTVRTLLNLEMAATPEMVGIAYRLRPDIVTLVPEKRQERTTEGGLALGDDRVRGGVAEAIGALAEAGIPVSLFIDPDSQAVARSAELGAKIVELHTGDYCNASREHTPVELQRLAAAAQQAVGKDLRVAAGHGLDYPNVEAVAALPGVEELNIGHSIISRAAFVGLDRAVRDLLEILALAAYR